MAEVKVLIEGFTTADTENTDEERTQCTISLVRDDDLVIVVDPGVMENRNTLIYALEKEGLTIDDVNLVFITHSHMDHYRNIGMFPDAKSLDYTGLWEGNKATDMEENLTENIQIIDTPGHANGSLTMMVKTSEGLVAICGDVFWKEDKPDNDPYAVDLKELEKNRRKVKELADFIVPGHAGMYKVKK